MTTEEEKKLGLDDEDEEDEDLDDEDEDLDDEDDSDEDDSDDEEDDDSKEDDDEEETPRKKSPKIDFSKLSKEDVEKIAKSALRQKGKLKKKLADLESDGGSKKKTHKEKEERRSPDNINLERIEFRQDHPELKRKEVDAVERFAKANGMSMDKALKDDVIKTYIAKRLEKRGAQEASISGRSQGAPLRRKGEKDWSTASKDEYLAKRQEIANRRS